MVRQLPNWATDEIKSLDNFEKIRLIVADLDGTVLPSELLNTLQFLIKQLRHHRYQVDFTIATGRVYQGAKPILDKLPIPESMPLILYNGSLIVKRSIFSNELFDILSQKTIIPKSLQAVINISLKYRVRVYAYLHEDPIYSYYNPQKRQEFVLGWSTFGGPEKDFNGMIIRWQNAYTNLSFSPSAILIDILEDQIAVPLIEEELVKFRDISFTRSSSRYIEVRPKDSNKGIALEFIAEKLHLTSQNILAIGDNDNDAEMLQWAGIGVAIAGASQSAIENSDYVCRYGAFGGTIEVLQLVREVKHCLFQPEKRLAKEE